MFYNLNIAFRNLRRNGLYSLINIIGLSVGLTACIFITLWLQNELSHDRFHKNAGHLYRVNAADMDGDVWVNTPAPVARVAKENCPDVVDACRVAGYRTDYLEYNNQKFFGINGLAVDDNLFTIFDFPLLEGNNVQPFPDDLSIIISERKANTLFGEESPMGKIIKTSDGLLFHVAGVAKNAPVNSSLQFDFLVPRLSLQQTFRGNGPWKHIDDDLGWYRYQTFLLLRPGADVEPTINILSRQLTDMRNAYRDKDDEEEDDGDSFLLQPITKIHLYNPDNEGMAGMKSIYLLIIITLFILVIACINYVNLVTARAAKRVKEIAVRKIMGATRSALFFQLMQETIVLLFVAFAIASVFIVLLMPVYNQIIGKELVFSFTNPAVWLVYGIMGGCSLILTGIYPAFVLSAFRPVDAFRSNAAGRKKGAWLRKGLVILQFMISFILLVTTIGFSAQIRYMQKKDLGYDRENIFTMQARNMRTHYEEVTAADFEDMYVGSSRSGAFWLGKPDDFNPWIYTAAIQSNFMDCMNLELVAGEKFTSVDSFAVVINEEAARIMNMQDPIGQLFYMNKGDKEAYTIKGVMKDFHFEKLNQQIKPLVITHHPKATYHIYIKTAPGGTQSALETAGKLWKQYNPDYDFNYHFLDENFDRFYEESIYMERLLSLFAVIAIFISCIGLFGLVTYTAETRTKEIGIRKVLGADTGTIVLMLSKEFLLLVGIAMFIAFPIVYYYLHSILQNYAYHIPVAWWIFAIGIVITLLLTLLSVSFQAIKAATANPVDAIKTE